MNYFNMYIINPEVADPLKLLRFVRKYTDGKSSNYTKSMGR